jgi:general secretion pathway protein A
MYTEFYHLTNLPFQLTPDPRFFFASSEHNRAMAHLTYGLHQGEGFIIITGDVGAGKTTLVDYLLTTLPPSEHMAAKIVTTQLGADDMLRMVAAAFNLFEEGADKATLLKRIEEFAGNAQAQGKRILLVVDEAQNLPIPALEELRMLSNIIVGGRVPIQAVLLGQPQFRKILARPDLDQLRQRVTASYHLGPLNAAETRSYIEHRLNMVGWKRDPDFTESCFAEIFRYTDGVPRRINTLCSRLMLLGFLEEKHVIADTMVSQVATEMATELSAGSEKAPLAPLKPVNGDARPLDSADPAMAQISKRLTTVEQSVARHEQAIRRTLDIIVSYLERIAS